MSASFLCLSLAFAALAGSPARAPRSLPVVRPGVARLAGPSVRGDCFEIRIRDEAAARVREVRHLEPSALVTAARVRSLGLPELDEAAASVGGSFEPEFPGEAPPVPGSRATDFTAFYRVHLPPGIDLDAALARFRALGVVRSADPIAVLPVSRAPNDSLWSSSYWFYDPVGRHDIHAPEAWDLTTGDSAIVVGVLDTGVLSYHPEIGGTAAGSSGQIWTNPAEASGLPGVDDDGNGYVDDAHGWDFVDLGDGNSVSSLEDWRDPDPDPNDYAGHGTEMAGLIGAITDNRSGLAGTAWNVRIMPLRIGWSELAFPFGVVDMSYAAQAIRYATRMGARVLNCSFSTQNTSGLYEAASAATAAGVLIVTASGNLDPFHDLANREDVLAVAAADSEDRVTAFSNLGDFVDLVAPGVGMICPTVSHFGSPDSIGLRTPSYSAGLDGTSFAAPLAAGTAALVLARQRATGGRALRPMELLFRLSETADDIAALNPGVGGYGSGRLNAYRALSETDASFAARASGPVVGAPAVVPVPGGKARAALALGSGELLLLGGEGDTLRVVSLPAPALSSPATADLGGGRGQAIFVALGSGLLAGFDGLGNPLAGWPVSVAGDGVGFASTPMLVDLDGDGVLEIVCGTDDGGIYAWHADGSRLGGFPVSTEGLSADLAAADLDGVPGAEIVATTVDGRVRVFTCGGVSPRGWPKSGLGQPPRAPLVMRLGTHRTPCVVVAYGGSLRAYEASGAVRFTRALGATVAANPAATDLDGDGFDEIVVPLAGPDEIAVFDSSGAPWGAPGWPRAVPGALSGELVSRALDAGNQRAQIFVPVSGRIRGYGSDGEPVGQFPKPGRGVGAATAWAVDAGGPVRLLAGSETDSMAYFYSIPQPLVGGADRGWFTARGNFARTGARDTIERVIDRGTGLSLAVRTQPSRLPVIFDWHGAGSPGEQVLRIYDVTGRRQRVIPLGAAPSGSAQWNGRDERGRSVPAGVYFARLTSGSLHAQTRVVLLP